MGKAKKDKNKPKLTEKTKHIKNILITPKRFCFAIALLPFGAIWKANAICTHLQIAQADPQSKICKRVQFLPSPLKYLLQISNNYVAR